MNLSQIVYVQNVIVTKDLTAVVDKFKPAILIGFSTVRRAEQIMRLILNNRPIILCFLIQREVLFAAGVQFDKVILFYINSSNKIGCNSKNS